MQRDKVIDSVITELDWSSETHQRPIITPSRHSKCSQMDAFIGRKEIMNSKSILKKKLALVSSVCLLKIYHMKYVDALV